MRSFNWYDNYQNDLLKKEAGIQSNIASLIAAVSLILGGMSVDDAAAANNVPTHELSQAAKNPDIVNKARSMSAKKVEKPSSKDIKKKKTKMSAVDAIARTLYAEAKGESFDGKQAVATVIYNRAGGNPANMVSVVKQYKQFSCWNKGVPPKGNDTDKNWIDCVNLAKQMIAKTFKPTLGKEYKHYFNPDKAKPSWGYVDDDRTTLVKGVTIGNHYFLPNLKV